MKSPFSRRKFLKTTSLGASAMAVSTSSYGRIVGANDRISVGIIGCGVRGQGGHMKGIHTHAKTQNVEITAVCDPWRVKREEAAHRVKEWYGRKPRQFVSYRELLAMKDLDAVMIASCDHQHTTHLQSVAEAGKDVYCEKPLGMDFERVKSACDVVRKSGVVFQAGTQLRSRPSMTGCRELFRKGVLGKVSRIEQCRNGAQPFWYSYLKEAKPEDVAWEEFLMDRPMRPFSSEQFTGWMGYRDFCDGPIPQLGSHFIDLVHYITGAKYPESAVAQGGTFTWKDRYQFTAPDHVEATWIYPEGFMVSYTSNHGNSGGNTFSIFGDQGVMDLLDWDAPTVAGTGVYPGKKTTLGEKTPVVHISRPDHFLDWLQCIRSRNTPVASIKAGYGHAVAVIMAVKAFDSGHRQVYDATRREIRAG